MCIRDRRNYAAAIADLNRALDLTPDFALGYFQRAIARYKSLQAGNGEGPGRVAELRAIVSDFDQAIRLSPRMAFAYFNKGNLLAETGDYTSALMAYNKAIEIKPDFGEAYYNRVVAQSLSPLLVQQDAIDKWDGKLPTYSGGGALPFINIGK